MTESYIAIDLKSYYASVECIARGLDPLTANLLVADESRTDKTIVLAVSPSLKALGVPSRPRLFEARAAIRLAEERLGHRIEYIVAPPRMAEYLKISAQIYGIYLQFAAPEDIHIYSIDECFIYATPYMHFYKGSSRSTAAGSSTGSPRSAAAGSSTGSPRSAAAGSSHGASPTASAATEPSPAHSMAMSMIRAVLRDTGITATAGIGTNLYLAKVAMDIVAKKSPPDSCGVRIAELDEMSYRLRLWDHRPITDFWQVAGGTSRRLMKYGMRTMGDIASMSLIDEERLYKIFGINAELIIDHAWGIETCTMKDIKSYHPSAHSMNSGQVLPRPYAFAEGRLILTEMIDSLSYDMMKAGVVSDRFTYWVSFDPKSLESGAYSGPLHIDYYGRIAPAHVCASVRLGEKTSSCGMITAAIRTSFDKRVDKTLLIRRLGVAADNITHCDEYTQLDLFTDYAALERERRLRMAMLSIKHRYGENALVRGMNLLESATSIERNSQIGGHRA